MNNPYVDTLCHHCGEFVTPIYNNECPNCGESLRRIREEFDDEDEYDDVDDED